MEDKLLDKEKVEDIEEICETSDTVEEYDEPDEVEWSAIKRGRFESKFEKREEIDEEISEPELSVVSEDEIEPYEEMTDEFDSPDTKEMAKQAKKARKAARREVKENEVDYEDDGSIFKSKFFRDNWQRICFVLLLIAIGIPAALLVYTIMTFFL